MTYKTFQDLAENPPRPQVDSIIRLEHLRYNHKAHTAADDYPIDTLVPYQRTYFHTLEAAGQYLSEHCEDFERSGISYHRLYEFETASTEFDGDEDTVTCRLYDSTGKLVDRTYVTCALTDHDARHHMAFRGRDGHMKRFRDGDIVEVCMDDGRIELSMVVDVVCPSVRACYRAWMKAEEEALADGLAAPTVQDIHDRYSWSGCYDGMVMLSREHPHGNLIAPFVQMFPPAAEVPEACVSCLKSLYDAYKDAHSDLFTLRRLSD